MLVWLEGKVVQNNVRHEAMIEWIVQALAPLKRKWYSLGQMVRGRFIIARRLLALLDEAKAKRGNQAHQRLFALEEVVVDPAVAFRFSDLAYPMRSPCPAPMEWPKHYYEVPGDLPYRRKDGQLAEEYRCATAIERNPDVEVWVRTLAHPSQFRFPTATGSSYPDFIAQLKDGRIFVIEYKGDDRYDHPKNIAKRAVGELWARKYPNGLYLMPREKDEAGRDIDQQIAHAISSNRLFLLRVNFLACPACPAGLPASDGSCILLSTHPPRLALLRQVTRIIGGSLLSERCTIPSRH